MKLISGQGMIIMVARKHTSSHEIIQRYKEGERDFSNVLCQNGDFNGINLSGAIFRDADLSFSGFDGSDLTDTDFTNAILDWSTFKRTTLRRTNFTGAKIQWSVLNDTIVDNTIFRNADLSWSIMLNTMRNNADWTGANFITCAFDLSDLQAIGIKMAPSQLEMLRSKIPYDTWLRIKFSLENVAHQFSKTRIDIPRKSYSDAHAKVSYNIDLKGGSYSVHQGAKGYQQEEKYASENPYISKKRKKDNIF